MDINKDEFVEKFINDHPELVLEFKWTALFALMEDSKLCGGNDKLKQDCFAFLEVFHKHNVDPEVVMEAMIVVMERQKSEATVKSDISGEELTNFVSTLMKIRKQQEADTDDEEENDQT